MSPNGNGISTELRNFGNKLFCCVLFTMFFIAMAKENACFLNKVRSAVFAYITYGTRLPRE
jgi:hypothetical protein